MVALLACTPAFAASINCSTPSSNNSSCTIPSGTYSSTPLLSGEGDNGGDRGPDYTLTNNGTISISGNQYWGLAIGSIGHDGSSSSADGGDGGNLVLINNSTVTVAGSSTNLVYGLYARSKGGDGNSDNGNGSNGGRGGDGGHIGDNATGNAALAVRINNSSTVTINQSLPGGGVGIYAETRAGQGGDQNSSVFGDQAGGNSGDAKDISITNSGTVALGASSSNLHGQNEAWGIAALARGNKGGEDNGKGGTGGNITISNTGTVNVYWNGNDGTPNGVRGIYALSQGGDGTASNDDSDAGGKGEAGYQIQITHSGVLNVVSQQAAQGLSGGIVAISQGGDGGAAPGSNKGGNGGNASDTTGSIAGLTKVQLTGAGQIFTDGQNVSGVIVRSKGGNGGNGQDGEKDSSGGNGGDGGAIAIELHNSAYISTQQSGSYGVLGQSIGGSGGVGGNKAALLGQGGGGGYGGNGGSAQFSGSANTQISTAGDYSTAVTIQSIGGNGGTAGDFLAVLGGSGGDGGNGGNGGAVSVASDGVLTTTGRIAHGILAQSIAGSGGTGDIPDGKFALGGDGGSGGDGGTVSVTHTGTIQTSGLGARGIVAQSISGGGGDAGTLGGGFIVIGGSAGGGGTAGQVTVSNSGSIATLGDGGTGIVAQSIGGGGGTGGGTDGIISVGASGGGGGDAEKVTVTHSGSISTQGSWANGITAQSIGGGGGDGGLALDFSILVPNVGVGGSAGAPGSSKDVIVGNYDSGSGTYLGSPSIATTGAHSYGVLAQSIGGGGGSGGSVLGGGLLNFFTLQIGGDAADGSKGNDVTVRFKNLTLTTQGTDGIGIVAQSIGGGGGVGGNAFGGTVSPVFSSAVAVGGVGGQGGDGDTVTVDLTDSTLRTGVNANPNAPPSDAIGILAQSIGGGGGVGGHAFSGALAGGVGPEVPITLAATLSVGGSGGAAGDGDTVTINLNGATALTTVGASSHGILAQSIGGGGGHGSMGWTYAVGEGLGGTLAVGGVGVALGGNGGAAGNGGAVTVSLHGSSSITTNGPDADGIVAQSIGGGGGDAGAASAGASGSFGLGGFTVKEAVGGAGGGGGEGGTVQVTLDAGTSILTQGGNSHGIVAQSIGGGGGTSQGVTAGGTIRVGPEFLADATLQGSMSIGLTGGVGGDAQPVTVNANGSITTEATGSVGIVAQSIGGGGGIGGSVAADAAVSGSILAFYFQAYQVSMGVGGSGGQGGNGSTVTINQSGTITTAGDHAIGVLAQSVGGGGGLGGSAVTESGFFKPTAELNLLIGGSGGSGGAGGTVFGNFNGAAISTSGYMAHGAVLQSIGGGGGLGADASDEAQGRLVLGGNIGGSGGAGNDGGNVGASGSLTVSTTGSDAIGLLAQSVGGGGGIAGQGNATRSSKILSATLELAVGGTGGTGGDGGTVQIGAPNSPFTANITTHGDRAYGLVAQSVGGGGGIGGTGSADTLTSLTLGGSGNVAGNGGNVSVYAGSGASTIITDGAGAHALVAQSVGGGGGIGGDVSSPGLSLSRHDVGGNGRGSGGSVNVDFNGTIETTGSGAFGIFAQSVGGGGGFGGDASGSFAGSTSSGGGGAGGAVTVNQQGTIFAVGTGGVGIFAQSQGPGGTGVISVTVQGTVIGNQNGGAGVLVSGGHNNTLTITDGGYVSGNGGTAISYAGNQSTSAGSVLDVYNYGTIDGDVILTNAGGTSAGTVNNYSNNTLNAHLIEANVVNTGTIIVGGRNQIGATHITGNFEQTRTGTMKLDADFAAGRIDHLTVDGNAKLDGRVSVAAATLLPRALTFLDVGGTSTGSLQGVHSNVFDFTVAQSGNSYTLNVAANFDQPGYGLTTPQARAADYLQSLWNAGGGSFGSFFATLAAANAGAYSGALSSLTSDTMNAPAADNLALMQQRLDRMMSCPAFQGASALPVQTECVWAQAGGGNISQGSFDGAASYGDTVYSFTMGGQKQIAPDWFLGFAAGYENSQIQNSGSSFKSAGQVFSAGASLKYQTGAWLFAGGLGGNFGSFDNTRVATIGSFGGTATSTQDVGGFGGRLRAAYTWTADSVYVKPYVDLDLIYTNAGSYGESGAGLLDQQVSQSSRWGVVGTPSVEIGKRFDLGPGYTLRGYARAGVSVSSVRDWTTQTRLAAAPSGAGGFDVTLPMDTVYGRVGAGVQLAGTNNGLSVRVEYDGAFSGHTSRNGGSLRVAQAF